DANLDDAIAGAMVAKLRNGGQACTSANRFLVHADVAPEFSERLAAEMRRQLVGPGDEPGVSVGPLINDAAIEKVARLVNSAVEGGAELLIGGEPAVGKRYFYPPTVLVGVAADAPILREEIFGPVAPIVTFASEAEAIELANAT